MKAEPLVASIHINAPPEHVFEHFVSPEAVVGWDGRLRPARTEPGGRFVLDINGVPARGAYLELERPRRPLISWGHAGPERPPPGSSTVEIRFIPEAGGTLVEVIHSGLPEPDAAQHATGWEHFLDRLAVLASGGYPGPDPWAETAGEPQASRETVV